MIGMAIIPHALTSASRIILSTLSLKWSIGSFMKLVYSAANHSYNLLPFLPGTVILLFFKNRERVEIHPSEDL